MTKKLTEFGADFKHQEHNPRLWTKKDRDALLQSLTSFGDLSGIVHDLNSGQIVSGNFRSEIIGAVENPDQCEIEIVHQNDAPDEQGTVAQGFVIWNGKRYAYRQVRWTDKQCEEACIKANYLGGSTDWEEMANYWSAKYGDALLEWGVNGWPTGEEQSDTTAEPPTDLDATDVDVKPFVAKLTFDTDEKCQRFVALYRDELIQKFGCTVNISGGAI